MVIRLPGLVPLINYIHTVEGAQDSLGSKIGAFPAKPGEGASVLGEQSRRFRGPPHMKIEEHKKKRLELQQAKFEASSKAQSSVQAPRFLNPFQMLHGFSRDIKVSFKNNVQRHLVKMLTSFAFQKVCPL